MNLSVIYSILIESEMTLSQRIKNYTKISTELSLLDNAKLSVFLEEAEHNYTGIGGKSFILNISGEKVFVKKVPLINLEMKHFMSTANLFDLPLCYQYGVGSTGFGAWRELLSHVMTTNWVLSNECVNFPMMYSWRILPTHEVKTMNEEDVKKLKETVETWNDSPGILLRLQEINSSSVEVVIFLEYIPNVLWNWLNIEFDKGDDRIEKAIKLLEKDVNCIYDFLKTKGFIHFDAHFGNFITDGTRVYLTDFGLSLSEKFDLSRSEREFLEKRVDYDRCQTLSNFVNWLVIKLLNIDVQTEDNFAEFVKELPNLIPKLLQDCDDVKKMKYLTHGVANILKKYKDIAYVWNNFFVEIKKNKKSAIYPGNVLNELVDKIVVSNE